MSKSKPTRGKASEPTPIVTFYSYKGGVGRSMAVLNVASLIASRGFRVLIIDFDLEAPGLSHLIGKEALPAKKEPGRKSNAPTILKDGVIELLSDAVLRGSESDLFSKPFSQIAGKYTFAYKAPVGLKQHAGATLSIMPSGRLDEDYSSRLDSLNLPGLYSESENSGKRLILHLREVLIHSGLYDYILVDSRTGHSDEAGICTRDLADHRMVVSGLNTQNISGTAAFLHNLRIALTQENKPLKTPDIILSPIPNGEDDMVAEREKVARDEFQKAWRSHLEINLLIPYHPRLALTEEAYVPAITASPLRSAYLEIEGRLLRSLGHLPRVLDDRFRKSIGSGDGPGALQIFQQLIRLLRAPQFPGQTASHTGFQFRLGYDEDLLKQILRLDEALEILKLYAENTSVRFEATTVAKKIHDLGPGLAKAFDGFLIKLVHLHPDELGSYANFLWNIRKDHAAAEAFYKCALEADPKNPTILGNYAIFLSGIRNDHDAAEVFYKRALEADPKSATNLGNYAVFLTDIRKDHGAAEAFFKRALEADSKDSNNLGNYANYLTTIRKDHDAAEAFYKSALNADPKKANNLGNYANFLADNRKDHAAAEVFYKRALDADPKQVSILGNYGQFLTGRGRLEEGLRYLSFAWGNRNETHAGNTAELAYSLWLGSSVAGSGEPAWEGVFKHFIAEGFIRPVWSFDAMLAAAEKKLEPADFKYAKALAAAFLDASAIPALEKFPRWKKLKPLDPARVNPDGSISKQIER